MAQLRAAWPSFREDLKVEAFSKCMGYPFIDYIPISALLTILAMVSFESIMQALLSMIFFFFWQLYQVLDEFSRRVVGDITVANQSDQVELSLVNANYSWKYQEDLEQVFHSFYRPLLARITPDIQQEIEASLKTAIPLK